MALKWLNRLSSQCSSFQNLYLYNNFILFDWTVFNCKINIFEIIYLQLRNLNKSVDVPANS